MITASHIMTPDTRSIDWRQPVNWRDPLNHGLVSWWLAVPNHTSGTSTWRDLCGKNDGTLTNFANVDQAWKTQGQPGGFGALEFDGTDDVVDIGDPDSIDFSARDFTISAWVLRDDSSGTFTSTIISKWDQTRRQCHLHVRDAGSGGANKVQWETGAGSSDGGVLGVTELQNNQWYFVAGVYSDALTPTLSVYVNGRRESLGAGIRIGSTTASWIVGARDTTSSADVEWPGDISDVRIWDRALTADEIQDYYHRSQRYYPGLLNRPSRRSVFAPSTGTTITPATLSISAALQGSPPVSSRTIEVT